MAWDREKERKAGKNLTIASCVFGLGFSIFWCCMAAAMGAGFMLIFGIPFAGMMAYRLVMCIKLAKSEGDKKPAEPWERPAAPRQTEAPRSGSGYCPYCGAQSQEGFRYCPSCGRSLPQ